MQGRNLIFSEATFMIKETLTGFQFDLGSTIETRCFFIPYITKKL